MILGPGRSYTGGYVRVRDPRLRNTGKDDRILEHRLVVEQKIGRPLKSNEIVHHLNGVRTDNRPENLALIQGPEGHETWTFVKALQARIRDLEAQALTESGH